MFKRKATSSLLSVALLLLVTSNSSALSVNSPLSITHTVTIQPIIVSDNNGGNTATFMGSSGQQSIIEGFVDDIWAQAGIDVNFLSANSWDDTTANWGSDGTASTGRPSSDLWTTVNSGATAGVTNADSSVINMFFVNIAAGTPLRSSNYVSGYAFIGGNGITQFVGESLVSYTAGQEIVASVIAHEIGHNLGLIHTDGLMTSTVTQAYLSTAQANIALSSDLAVAAVPVPAAFWLMGSGIAILFRMKKKAS